METGKVYAVLTGDLIGSSRFRKQQREELISNLKGSFQEISPDIIVSPFSVFRGDSFQGVLARPEEALKTSLIIRASLRSRFIEERTFLDTRIAIGIGTIDYLPRDQVGEGDGEAFRNSGPELDKMKKGEQNIIIRTPWYEINEELEVECVLLETLIQRWTKEQAEAILYHIQSSKQTQERIAKILKISQSALSQRLKTGGYLAVEIFLERFKKIILDKVGVL
ncbi:MAG: SatD family protein [Candidatus Methanoperedens sp.]|nr:SatD family protein [Candidatus Methanoperedens sp.]